MTVETDTTPADPAVHAAPPETGGQRPGGDEATVRVLEPGRAEIEPDRYIRRRRRLERFLAWTFPAVLLGAWQLAASLEWIDVRFFPAPTTIVETAVELIESGRLQEEVWRSTTRILTGFFFGVLTGVVGGLLMGMFRTLRATLEPTLMALYTVPKLAILPLLLLIFGLGDTPKIVVVTITVFFFMWVNVMESIISTPKGYREAMESFGANRWQMFRHVYLPHSLPQMFVTMRLCAGIAILVMIGIEFVQGSDGIGFLIWNSWSLFIATQMYVGIVTVALMGLVFATIIKVISQKMLPWAPNDRTHGVA